MDLSPRGNPPALPEDPQSLTVPGVPVSLAIVNRSKFTKGDKSEGIRNAQAYNLGVQISCGVHSEISEESTVWAIEAGTWERVPGTCRAKRMRDRRGALDGRSCAHADLGAAEVFGGTGHGVYQREKCDPYRKSVCRTKKELRWAAFLGEEILGVNGGKKRIRCAPLHPGAGKGRSAARANEPSGALSASL